MKHSETRNYFARAYCQRTPAATSDAHHLHQLRQILPSSFASRYRGVSLMPRRLPTCLFSKPITTKVITSRSRKVRSAYRAFNVWISSSRPGRTLLLSTAFRTDCKKHIDLEGLRQELDGACFHGLHRQGISLWPVTKMTDISGRSTSTRFGAYAKARITAPMVMRDAPPILSGVRCSPRKSHAPRITRTTLSLSTGATLDAGPICRARK